MAVQKLVAFPLWCLAAALALATTSGRATAQDALKTTPIGNQPVAATPVVTTDANASTTENNTKAFNTPETDGRPGEYYFDLGAQAVKHKDYAHAIDMYEVAASWAYKPAEYNLGVMYLSGQGTPVDLPRALAWMALAAERKDPQYVKALDLISAHLTDAQFNEANVIMAQLLPTYGDKVAMARAKTRWREALQNATGSRVGSSAAHVEVGGVAGTANHMSSPIYDVSGGGAVTPSGAERAAGGPVTSDPAQVAGVHQTDGAVAYQQLRSTDNPYDPKLASSTVTGTVTGTVYVGQPSPVKKKDGEASKDNSGTPADAGDQSHP